jgi:hypothetical protein
MFQRVYYSHYRTAREVITTGLTIGMAMMMGYLILWARL